MWAEGNNPLTNYTTQQKGEITCLSFFDFFTFIFIFFPEIMLYLPFFRSFKYWNETTDASFTRLEHKKKERKLTDYTTTKGLLWSRSFCLCELATYFSLMGPWWTFTLEIWTGPEFSSPFAFLSFLRLCRFSFFPFCKNKFQRVTYKILRSLQILETWDKKIKNTFLGCFSFFLFLDCFLDLLRESEQTQCGHWYCYIDKNRRIGSDVSLQTYRYCSSYSDCGWKSAMNLMKRRTTMTRKTTTTTKTSWKRTTRKICYGYVSACFFLALNKQKTKIQR